VAAATTGRTKRGTCTASSASTDGSSVASELDPDTGEPTGGISEDNTEGRRVAELVRTIAGGPLGQAQLIKRSVEILSVPGEYWTAILVTDTGVRWLAVTRDEIRRSQRGRDTVAIDLPDGKQHEFNPAKGDGMFRVWNADARVASDADSPVRSNLDPLREIVTASRKIRNADLSRLIGNGILIIPQEASLPDQNAPVSADKPGDVPPAGPSGRVAQKLQTMVADTAKIAVEEGPGSLASLVPMIIAAPAEHVDKIKHVKFSDEITKVAIETRNDAIDRLAMGLDMTPEQLRGLGDTNHWSGRQLADEDVNMHVKPLMETICQAIYDNALRNVLVKAGINPDKYVLWYDASDLTVDPDKTDELKDAHERGAITSEALVRGYGLPDDAMYDFSSLDGWRQWAQDKVSLDPTLLPSLLPLLDASLQAIDFPQPQQALPPGNEPDGDEPQGDPQAEPATEDAPPDGQAAAVRGSAEVGMAVELMVTRALDLANKRRVKTNDHMQQARLRGVPSHEYHRYMPPVAGAEVPKLIKGWDAGLDDIAARYGLDADEVRAVVLKQARRELTAELVDGQVG
jgi:hypothetical protein